jgi:hypothetical protein
MLPPLGPVKLGMMASFHYPRRIQTLAAHKIRSRMILALRCARDDARCALRPLQRGGSSAAGVNYIAAAFNTLFGAFHPQRSAGPALAKMA